MFSTKETLFEQEATMKSNSKDDLTKKDKDKKDAKDAKDKDAKDKKDAKDAKDKDDNSSSTQNKANVSAPTNVLVSFPNVLFEHSSRKISFSKRN